MYSGTFALWPLPDSSSFGMIVFQPAPHVCHSLAVQNLGAPRCTPDRHCPPARATWERKVDENATNKRERLDGPRQGDREPALSGALQALLFT